MSYLAAVVADTIIALESGGVDAFVMTVPRPAIFPVLFLDSQPR